MLSTATALIQATEDSIFDDEVMGFARYFSQTHEGMETEQFAKAIYAYSCVLASNAVDKAMKVLLNESQIVELMNAIDELEQMRDEVINNGE